MKNRVVALTGGIGSGKSSVAEILRDMGYATIDCDQIAREVAVMPEVAESIRKLLGNAFVVDGQLNRRAIREKVFADEELLSQYNAIFFGRVQSKLEERLSNVSGTVFVEISVFDAFEFPWDEVWLVESDVRARKLRVMQRDGVSETNVDEIIARQRVCESYSQKILNDGDIDALKQRVVTALNSL